MRYSSTSLDSFFLPSFFSLEWLPLSRICGYVTPTLPFLSSTPQSHCPVLHVFNSCCIRTYVHPYASRFMTLIPACISPHSTLIILAFWSSGFHYRPISSATCLLLLRLTCIHCYVVIHAYICCSYAVSAALVGSVARPTARLSKFFFQLFLRDSFF